jgi:hypothetical protein
LYERATASSSLNELDPNHVPDFAFALEAFLELVSSGKSALLDVEELDPDLREISKRHVHHGGASYGLHIVGGGLVRPWSDRNDDDFVEAFGQLDGGGAMVKAGWIEATSEDGELLGHGSLIPPKS